MTIPSVSSFPRHLVQGYQDFRENRQPGQASQFKDLAENGQKPQSMIIGCCDSRSAPEMIFGTAPGDMFVVRNVANVVPPLNESGDLAGTSSAVEFAVIGLGVKHIIVMGHARCGGVQAFRKKLTGNPMAPLSSANAIGNWISLLEPVGQKIERTSGESEEQLQFKLETASIRQSVENLKDFPFVKERMESDEISVHGAWFDIATAELWVMDAQTGEFEKADA